MVGMSKSRERESPARGVRVHFRRGLDRNSGSRLSEYFEHAAFLQTLFTPLRRALCLEGFIYVPGAAAKDFDATTVEYFIAFFHSLRQVPECEIAATRILRWWVDDISTHAPALLPETIASLRDRLPEQPPWPPPPRPAEYYDELVALAASFRESVEQRSLVADEGPGPDDWGAYQKRHLVEEQVRGEEDRRRAEGNRARWGAYR